MNYEKMKALREVAGLTQEQLGEKALTSRSMIAGMEAGAKEPSLALLERVAAVFGLVGKDLL